MLKVTDMPGSWRRVVVENWQPQTCLYYVEASAWGDDTGKNRVRVWNGACPLCPASLSLCDAADVASCGRSRQERYLVVLNLAT